MTIKPIQEAQILDFGKVALLEVMGNDKSIVDAARVSYADTSKHRTMFAKVLSPSCGKH